MKVWIDYLTKNLITLAVIGFLMSFAISYRSYGLAEGLTVGEQELEEFKTEIGYVSAISSSGRASGTYDDFAVDYGWLSLLVGICVVAILLIRIEFHIQATIISYALAGLSVLLILYKLRILIRDKAWVEPYFWEVPRNAFAHLTITYDWILIAITTLLIAIQLSAIVLRRKLKLGPHS